MASFKELDKGKYKLYVELGYDARGKRIRKTKTVNASGVREAKRKLAAFETEVFEKGYVSVKDMSFAVFTDTWKKEHAEKKYSASTYQVYEELLEGSLLPYFKNKRIKDIKPLHLVQYFNDETEAGRGQLEKKYNLLQNLFKKAVAWEVIEKNPMETVDRPARKKPQKNFYSRRELGHLFEEIKELLPYQQVIIKLAAVGGLRRGEILALTDKDIDGNKVHIRRSLQSSKREGLKLKQTKTEDSRTVTLPADLIKELKMLHTQQLRYKMQMGNLWKGFNGEIMLFANEEGVPYQPHSISTMWRRFVKRKGLKQISFHDLRHSSASLMISKGINMKIVQKRLGHKDVKTTLNIYSHVTEEDDKEASDVFNDFF